MTQSVIRLILLVLFIGHASFLSAQEKKPTGIPPVSVVVSVAKPGQLSPEVEFVGTVFFLELSDVAAESSGRIEVVNVEEGKRLRKGEILVKLNSDLLQKTLQGMIATHEEVITNLERAKIDLDRIENLYRKKVVAEQLYDENRFKVQSLEKKAASLLAEVERLTLEIQRKSIKAPFDGLVVKKHVDTGEWLQPGSAVATLARDEMVDVIVEVPENILRLTKPGMEVKIKAGGKETRGKVFAIIPRGDTATRTFPVKVRMNNPYSLVEGMEARVSLPSMESKKSLLVSRDAILTLSGQTVVFAVVESKAKMIAVKVIGYQGQMAGIEGEGLVPEMKLVVKGNERLRDGQPVTVLPVK